jgi:hypothetical protein
MQEPSGSAAPLEESKEEKEYPCLVRATDGKGKDTKVKISTLVSCFAFALATCSRA